MHPRRPPPGTPGAGADRRRLLTAQGLRSAGGGATGVLLGVSLRQRGASPAEVGVVLTAILLGGLVALQVVGRTADRVGRRRVAVAAHLLLAGAGAVLALSGPVWPLVLAGLTGAVLPDAADRGPFATLDQVMLASLHSGTARLRGYSAYNTVGALAGAAGSLLAAVAPMLARALGHPLPDRLYLLGLVPVGLLGAGLLRRVSGAVEAAPGPPAGRVPDLTQGRGTADLTQGRGTPDRSQGRGPAAGRGLERSRPVVLRLSGLFAVDSFAGGLVVQAFIGYWLARRYGASASVVGGVFVGLGLAQALSYRGATWIAERIGLLPTMVVTHLPSNLVLAVLPLAPGLGAAAVLLVVRALLSQMDVPTRSAYVMALVDPAERTAAATATASARGAAKPLGPLAAGALASVSLGLPFLVAGAVKAGYDLALWGWFRHVRLTDA